MKSVIVAVVASYFGLAIGLMAGPREVSVELRTAYGCGMLSAMKEANKMLSHKVQLPELTFCARYRELWDAPR